MSSRRKSFVVVLSLVIIDIEVNSLAFSVVADDLVLAYSRRYIYVTLLLKRNRFCNQIATRVCNRFCD